MASTDNEVPAPIIIKKVKKYAGGHHGGAWKVAYADFVTAMMAFFLLMWLLNVTTEEQKNAISNYFDPTHPRVSSELSGSGGILGGMTMSPDGAQVSNVQDVAKPTTPTTPRTNSIEDGQRDETKTSDFESNASDGQDDLNIYQTMDDLDQAEIEQLQSIIDQAQNEDFEGIKQKIMEEVENSPELADLKDHLMIDITPEGLRIQIVDKDGRSMFPSGSANMFGFMNDLVNKVTQIIVPQPNQISVRGHTDGTKYPDGAKYNNWNLSADRALASQKSMIDAGLTTNRIENVIGKADNEHLLPDDPLSSRNRRISIVLLREKLANADEIRQKAATAIQKKREKIKNTTEDRTNRPELDQTLDNSASFTIENDAPPLTEAVEGYSTPTEDYAEPEKMIGNEIQRIRDRNNSSTPSQQIQPRSQLGGNDPQVLDFP